MRSPRRCVAALAQPGTFPAMRRIALAIALAAILAPAAAQVNPSTLPANTVVGRLGTGAGPAQAIPFTTLNSVLSTTSSKFIGVPPLSDTFQGNAGSGAFFITGAATAGSNTLNEWVAQFPMTSSFGSANHTTATKGGIFADCVANAGSGDCWGANFIASANSGLGNTANVTGLEVDVNNGNQNYGESGFRYNAAGPPNQYGLTIATSSANNGTSGFRSSAGLYISALNGPSGLGNGPWNRGIAIDSNSVAQHSIEDASSSTISYFVTGTHTTGLDLTGATLTQSMILPNNAAILQKDSGGTARNVINLTGTNTFNIGDGVHNTFIVGGSGVAIAPSTDNQVALGGSANNWSNIFGLQATLGEATVGTGQLSLKGTTSGTAVITAQAVAGTPTVTLGTSSGTPAVTASAPLSISSTTGNISLTSVGSGQAALASYVGFIRIALTGVNFNSANTDNPVTITLPTGISRYTVQAVKLSNASASISTATIGVFTATGGGGQTIAATQAVTVTATATDTVNNAQTLTITNSANEAYNDTTLQVRIGNAQGSAATADVILTIVPMT